MLKKMFFVLQPSLVVLCAGWLFSFITLPVWNKIIAIAVLLFFWQAIVYKIKKENIVYSNGFLQLLGVLYVIYASLEITDEGMATLIILFFALFGMYIISLFYPLDK